MPNVFQNPDMLAAKSLLFFKNELVFSELVDRQWDDKFGREGAKIGDSLRLRDANNFTVRTGNAFTPQDIEETVKTLVIDTPLGVDFIIDNADMSLTIDRFEERYARPALRALANKVDRYVAELYRNVPNATGTYNTAPSAFADFQAPRTRLNNFGVPEDDRYFVVDPDVEAAAVSAMSALFNNQSEIGKQYMKGSMGRALGAPWRMTQNVIAHTAGLLGGAANALTNGANQTGSTLNIDGVTASQAAWAKHGDLFTLAATNAVNPITGEDLGFLRQFTVTADADSNGSGEVALPIYPAITTSGPKKTVSAAVGDGVALTFMTTTASQVARQPIYMHKAAFALTIAPEPQVRGVHSSSMKTADDAPIGIRYVCWYDGDTNQFKFRYDVLVGRLAQNPDYACRIHTS